MAERHRLKRVTFVAAFLATVTATTAFTRDDTVPAVAEPGALLLASRADALLLPEPNLLPDPAPTPAAPAFPPLATEISTQVPTTAPSQPTPAIRPQPATAEPTTLGQPAWQRHALAAPPADGRPLIAIVIDDVGVNRRQAQRVLDLPGPLTMSLMSYAENLPTLARQAREAGHELMLHLPMEPHAATKEPGPNALLTGADEAELRRRIDWALDRFSGYVGINNHMGSRFTESEHGMSIVMEAVAERGLLFLDSRTSPDSVAYETALDFGIPAATRQVFLDHDLGPEAVRTALAELEEIAAHRGYAIGIAHPHEATIGVIRRWLETLEQRGFRLAPISTVVARNYDLG